MDVRREVDASEVYEGCPFGRRPSSIVEICENGGNAGSSQCCGAFDRSRDSVRGISGRQQTRYQERSERRGPPGQQDGRPRHYRHPASREISAR
jgi:hypothetical protein